MDAVVVLAQEGVVDWRVDGKGGVFFAAMVAELGILLIVCCTGGVMIVAALDISLEYLPSTMGSGEESIGPTLAALITWGEVIPSAEGTCEVCSETTLAALVTWWESVPSTEGSYEVGSGMALGGAALVTWGELIPST